MRYSLLALAAVSLAACQTPGYDYEARIAPNYPQAAEFRDPEVGRFRGPAGDVAEAEFSAMISQVSLDGMPWFECTNETVNVSVKATLVDLGANRPVFTSVQPGSAARDTCIDIAEYRDGAVETGTYRDPYRSTYNPYDAPIGLVRDAVVDAVGRFRYDIAPYNKTLRAEIMQKGLIPEEQNDTRFTLAVDATKNGNLLGACAQWDELAREYPRAPAVLHNQGACAEARGDMETAQLRYARAAELASQIPLMNDKSAKPIFDALERVSGRRYDEQLLDASTPKSGS